MAEFQICVRNLKSERFNCGTAAQEWKRRTQEVGIRNSFFRLGRGYFDITGVKNLCPDIVFIDGRKRDFVLSCILQRTEGYRNLLYGYVISKTYLYRQFYKSVSDILPYIYRKEYKLLFMHLCFCEITVCIMSLVR